MKYYHGTKQSDLTALTVEKSKDGKVYVTNSRLVALTYGVRVFPNLFTTLSDGRVTFLEVKPNLFEKMCKGKSCYIYIAEDKQYEPVKQSKNCSHLHCYMIEEDVKLVEREFVDDIYNELGKYIKSGEFKVEYYQDMNPAKREAIVEDIKKYKDYKVEKTKDNYIDLFL